MKILLSSAIISADEMLGQYSKGGGAYLPHGLLSIAGVLLKHGYEVKVLDPYVMEIGESELREFLSGDSFDLIGLGNCYTSQTDNFFKTAAICKEAQPQAKICIGGAHPTIFPHETLERCRHIDFLLAGEGEYPFLELVKSLESGSGFENVLGLFYWKGESIVANPPYPGIANADDIPILPYHLIPVHKYVPPPSNYKRLPTYGMLIQRGCPYQCIYCDTRIHGARIRCLSIDRAIEEINFLIRNYGMKGILFHDSIFTLNRKWTLEFCRRLVEEKIDLSWSCFTRADAVDDELCLWMKKAGCWSVAFGIESANQSSLDLIQKKIKVERIVSGIQSAKKAGMEVIGSIILCLPGEDEAMVKNTIAFVKKMDLDIVVFFMPVPFPGTKLYDICEAEGGLVQNIEWKDFRQWMDQKNPLYINQKLGKEKMLELYENAFRTFYLSPKYLWKNIMKIRSLTDIKKYATGFISIKDLIKFPIRNPFVSMRD